MGWLAIGFFGMGAAAYRRGAERLLLTSLVGAFYFNGAELVVQLIAKPLIDLYAFLLL